MNPVARRAPAGLGAGARPYAGLAEPSLSHVCEIHEYKPDCPNENQGPNAKDTTVGRNYFYRDSEKAPT
jgi:hypothetical protein